MFPVRLNLYNEHLPPRQKQAGVDNKLRVGYGEAREYGKTEVNMSLERATNKADNEKRRYVLNYSGLADAKGLIYFIGTDGMQHPFENPSMKNDGLSLSVVKGSNKHGTPSDIVNRNNGYRSMTDWKAIEKSYIEVDLNKKVRLRPNRYMIRSGMTGPNFAPTDWVLEGIECDKNGREDLRNGWKVIKLHSDDRSLFEKGLKNPHEFVACSYVLSDKENFGKEDGGFYSRFRVRLVGNNINGNAYFAIGSLEFWGILEVL